MLTSSSTAGPRASAQRRRIVLGLILAIAAAVLPAATANAVVAATTSSAVKWASSVGDHIANGVDGSITDQAATFTMMSSDAGFVWINVVSPPASTWHFQLSAGAGNTLSAGIYTTTSSPQPYAVVESPTSPGCLLNGTFTVLDVVHDGTGAVTSLAVRISGVCMTAESTFTADLRYQSAIGIADVAAPATKSFAPVPHSTTRTVDVPITSAGAAPLTVSSVALVDANVVGYSISHETCTSAPIAPGAQCVVTVRYTASTWTGGLVTLRVTTDVVRPTRDVAISATVSLPLAIGPASLAFGAQYVNETYAPRSVALRNIGTLPVTFNARQIFFDNPATLTVVSDTCSSSSLAVGATCVVALRFKADRLLLQTGQLYLPIVGGTGATAAARVNLSGSGAYRGATTVRSSIHYAAPSYTENAGGALARTAASTGGMYLHAVSTGNRVGSTTVKDAGPFSPVIYTRSGTAGVTWTAGTRLNSTSQHGVWPGLAASSPYVYATWVKVSRVVSWSTTAPRYLMFRSNAAHGSGTWTTAKALTSTTGRVDYPTIAAAAANVYIAYTDATTGSIKLLVSHNRGSTWTTVSLGTTSLISTAGGKTGLPSVAASGSNVIVAWTYSSTGSIRARVSTNTGTTWGGTATIAAVSGSYPSTAALGGRVGVGWIGAVPSARVWTTAGWGSTLTLPALDSAWLETLEGPSLVLIGTTGLGLGYSGCIQVCDTYEKDTRLESYYAESPNNGLSWYNGGATAIAAVSEGAYASNGLSIIASSSTKREITYNAWNPGTTTTRVAHRTLTITPTGLPVAYALQTADQSAVQPPGGRPFQRQPPYGALSKSRGYPS